jgi:cell division protease FtsH
VFDSVSTGASDDLKRASELAINMVGSLGFSDAFGLLSVAGVPKELLGPDIQSAVLREARLLLEQAQATCQQLLRANRAKLDDLAQRLLERDVISGDELKGLLGTRADEFVDPEFKLPHIRANRRRRTDGNQIMSDDGESVGVPISVRG